MAYCFKRWWRRHRERTALCKYIKYMYEKKKIPSIVRYCHELLYVYCICIALTSQHESAAYTRRKEFTPCGGYLPSARQHSMRHYIHSKRDENRGSRSAAWQAIVVYQNYIFSIYKHIYVRWMLYIYALVREQSILGIAGGMWCTYMCIILIYIFIFSYDFDCKWANVRIINYILIHTYMYV